MHGQENIKLLLYVFRAIICSSLGGQIVYIRHLVSSLSVSGCGGRAVHKLREYLCSERPPRPLTESDDAECRIYTIWPPEDEHIIARNM